MERNISLRGARFGAGGRNTHMSETVFEPEKVTSQ